MTVRTIEWAILAPLLPGGDGRRRPGRPTPDDRRVLNRIFFVPRTGVPWRDLRERYAPYATVYNQFNRWARARVWERLFEALATRSPHALHLIGDRRSANGRSSVIRAHRDCQEFRAGPW